MSPTRLSTTVLVATVLLMLAMAADAGPATRQYLDRRTGATITVATRELVFARLRTAYAVNARDYVSLVAVDVNRGGRHSLYWWGYLWSTIDDGRTGNPAATATSEPRWVLLADGRPIVLQPAPAPAAELGLGELPLARPVRHARAVLFVADAEMLDYVSRSTAVRVQTEDGSGVLEIWRDARTELRAFVGALAD